MFTGIIEGTGAIKSINSRSQGYDWTVSLPDNFCPSSMRIGDSIAMNGVCLTVTHVQSPDIAVSLAAETLACTTLGKMQPGDQLNLERALPAQGRLDGHLVSGHVDGVAEVSSRTEVGDAVRFCLRAPAPLHRFIASKGSVCLDGASLTVNQVEEQHFDVLLIPHTLAVTTLSCWQPGSLVNLEVDRMARYLQRLLDTA